MVSSPPASENALRHIHRQLDVGLLRLKKLVQLIPRRRLAEQVESHLGSHTPENFTAKIAKTAKTRQASSIQNIIGTENFRAVHSSGSPSAV